jgi:hypothetical protein
VNLVPLVACQRASDSLLTPCLAACYNLAVLAVDHLILALIATGHQATPDELTAIIAHVAQAPFATYVSRVPTKLRQLLATRGDTVPARLPSLDIHLLKRVYDEQQWPVGTTSEQYVTDLHYAVSHPNAQVWTYRYFSHPFVGFLAPSHVQGGIRMETDIFVAYSPIYGTITTGYQTSGVDSVFTHGFTDLLPHQ